MTFTDPEPKPTRPSRPRPRSGRGCGRRRSGRCWAGFSSLLTGLTTLARGDRRHPAAHELRELSLQDAAYASWNELNQASLANPELNCPETDAKLQKLLSTPDPRSATGGTFQDRYSAYGNLVITTSEQVLQMAPKDPYWRFRIAERIRCNAPAIRYLQREGSYDKRYSCRLRHVIAEVLKQPPPACDEAKE